MNIFTVITIAIGLSMDAFAVSITSGTVIKQQKVNNALRVALFFGIFQAAMPLLGWLAGLSLRDFISGIDHWIAFGLLVFIGAKMIYESFQMESKSRVKALDTSTLLVLSIATSIDALAVGISFAFLQVFIITPVIIIGMITFILSFLGIFIGDRIGHIFENRVAIIGGLVLIGIGTKILIEHLF